ncbi:IclR family transcriptional regulator [Brevibacillus ruminantium]|uniref:IclR family transcriptional regulator n=1 Tax=Brevibacillus ruminantium TaxID=2950604 RepID=A0ABY4WF30_9BACL|nr:IclR family transcriptional regulator [Brevibacillus ruminantium]USG65662.1 IclR family transcriptional regulator [Brevibacillus ruminantium]
MNTQETVNSVVHAIKLLEQFHNGEGLRASEISKRIGVPRATTYRLLKTLMAHQLVIQGEDKKYRLTLRLLELGNAALSIPNLQQIVAPFLIELAELTGETGHFSIVDGYHVGYIAKKDSPNPFRMLSHVGWRGPLHATASGKILLAHAKSEYVDHVIGRGLEAFTANTITDPVQMKQEIANARENGFAIDDEEQSEGLLCHAVPVSLGEQIGALSVSGLKSRILQRLTQAEIISILQEKSMQITQKLGR